MPTATSSLPFKSSLFGAAQMAIDEAGVDKVFVQPLTIAYTRLHGVAMGRHTAPMSSWAGAQSLGPQSAAGFLRERAVDVELRFGEPVEFNARTKRKDVARDIEAVVRREWRTCWPTAREYPGQAIHDVARSESFISLAQNGLEAARMELDLEPREGEDAGVLTGAGRRPARPKRSFVKTYGCQMNVYDSQRMADALAADGYAPTEAIEDADLVLLNTCHIREKAAEKVYSELGRIRQVKEARAAAGRETLIGIAGCVAQAEGAEIMRRSPAVDLVIGPQTYHRLPDVVRKARARPEGRRDRICHRGQIRPSAGSRAAADVAKRGVTAFLTVQEGCDKFCTFCVVPYTRGSEVSRPVSQIVAEAERLADAGVREVTLLGQNVNAWHGEGPDGKEWGLGRLLFRLAEIPGLARLRYTTSHPRDMDDELIAAHRDLPALMPYLHLPVQSGSDRILKAMNRRHTAADYLKLDRPNSRRAARYRHVGRLHCRLSGRDRRRFRGDAAASCAMSAMPRRSPSNIRRGPARLAPK